MAPGSRLLFSPANIQDIQCPCLVLDTESEDLGDQFFVSKNGKLSEFRMFDDKQQQNDR